jgi:hypothetical protein
MLKNNFFSLLMFVIVYPIIHLNILDLLGSQSSKNLDLYYLFGFPLLLIIFPIFNSLLNPNDEARKIINWLSLILFIAWFSFMVYLLLTGESV